MMFIFDDDVDDLYLIKKVLQDKGEEAFKLISDPNDFDFQRRYSKEDTMIIDLNMPKINGFDILDRLAKENQPVYKVVLTTSDNPSDRRRALDHGADVYVVKPDSLIELTRIIERILCQSQQRIAL